MQAIELLKSYKKELDLLLKKYFKEKIKRASRSHPLAEEAVKMIADFTLANGKRIRPAIVYYSYLAAGERADEKIIETSMCIELTHSFLLIHDDIIDRDKKRHGVSTIHERYRNIGRKMAPEKDDVHFGNSMAMLTGDMTEAMANEILFKSSFSPDIIIRALNKLQEIVYNIVPGEMLDVIMEMRGQSSEKEVLEMYEGKTSSYSFEGPLHLGLVLAGIQNEQIFKSYSCYAMSLGKAFQIRDDILGIFGDEKKLGKPVGSDIIEGKQTLLVIKALELGNKKQRETIKKYLGKKDLKENELEEFRKIMRKSGSLDYCQKLAEKFVSKALEVLSGIDIKNEEARVFFQGIAEYMILRNT
jgi:geranylgeranyl diphosphate synthase, type I